ncbi:MAG: DMT family transporter [Actinomycetota bacterium]
MAILLSLLTAAAFGSGDFLGGLAGKRMRVLQVVAVSHLVGLCGITIASLLLAERFVAGDLAWGALGGCAGGTGIALLYRGLARGPMGVVAPLTAITSASVPAVFGVVGNGERLALLAWIGVALALVAIGLVSATTPGTGERLTPRATGEALLAGVGFGLMFVALDQTDAASAPWPIVGARLLTSTLLVLVFVLRRERIVPADAGDRRLLLGAGLIDTGSNAMFLYANEQGALTIVAVLSSLYPVATVFLARVVLGERLTRTQQLGFVTALVATGLIAAG